MSIMRSHPNSGAHDNKISRYQRTPLLSLSIFLALIAALSVSGCIGLTSAGNLKGTSTSAASGSTLQVTTSPLPNAQTGIQFQAALSATGGVQPYQWKIASGNLPSGISLNAASGMLSGTPSQGGQFDFSAQVSDSSPAPQTAMKALALSVLTFGLQISSGSMPNGQVGVAFQATITGNGGVTPYTWSVTGALPSGLTLNSSSGAITGTPMLAGTSTFTLGLTDSTGQKAQKSSSITVAAAGSTVCGSTSVSPPASGLSLVCSGTGINETVTVESAGQFRLVFEAYDNWGIDQWYDLVNDPTATTNLVMACGAGSGSPGGCSVPCVNENGLAQMTFYGDRDMKLFQHEAGCSFPNADRGITILASSPSMVAIQTRSHPVNAIPQMDTNVTGTMTYYIYPTGKIYLTASVSVVTAQDLSGGGTCDLFFGYADLNDATPTIGSAPPDTQGWIRATSDTNPWNNTTVANDEFLFTYWGPSTPAPQTNFTKASYMIALGPNINAGGSSFGYAQIRHAWTVGTNQGTMRWGYRMVGAPNMTAGETITQQFMIQLGTQGSSVLPNINSIAVAGPIATTYRANPTPPLPPTISPVQPAVPQGGSQQFTISANSGTGGTFTCTNASNGGPCLGSITQAGVYTAPATVVANQSVGGYPLLPNDHVFNTRIDSLPANPNSASWIAGAGTVPVNYLPSFPINYADSSTPTDNMVFYYNRANSGTYQSPQWPNANIEGGWFDARAANHNNDHHMIVIDTTTGTLNERYQYYPTGSNSSCLTCNSQSGIKYTYADYALPANGTTDAAGLMLEPLTLHTQEVVNACTNGTAIKHALRMTLQNGYLHYAFLWPATTSANAGSGPNYYGERVRLKTAFNISGFSPCAQILLTQLKDYGLIIADGGYGWQIQVDRDNMPKAEAAALQEITGAAIATSNWEVVDESSLMVSVNSGAASNGEIVTYTSSMGSVSTNVNLLGTAVNVNTNQYYIMAGTPAQQLIGYSNGAVTWSMNPAVGTLTAGGLYTPPASVSTMTTTTVTVTSTVNPAVSAQMIVYVLPSTNFRLTQGTTNYTDSHGNVWYAGYGIGLSNAPSLQGCCQQDGSFSNITDKQLWWNVYQSSLTLGDMKMDFHVPAGTYQVTYNNGTIRAAGQDARYFYAQGALISTVDPTVAAGGVNLPYTLNTNVTVGSNNTLSFYNTGIGNQTWGTGDISSIQITPQ
jgi:Putative Ig domain